MSELLHGLGWNLTDLEATITAKAWSDEDFRRRLLADPQNTIEQAAGAFLPPGVRISVHEQAPDHIHIVIPPAPYDDA